MIRPVPSWHSRRTVHLADQGCKIFLSLTWKVTISIACAPRSAATHFIIRSDLGVARAGCKVVSHQQGPGNMRLLAGERGRTNISQDERRASCLNLPMLQPSNSLRKFASGRSRVEKCWTISLNALPSWIKEL